MKSKFIEIYPNSFDESLKNALFRLKSSGSPLIIRNSHLDSSLENWHNFLCNNCNFSHDRRQKDTSCDSYFSDFFEIANHNGKSTSFANSCNRHPLHTDNAWFKDGAELVFLYILKQAHNGGECLFYSLEDVIYDLEKEEKELLNDLCSIPVKIQKGDDENSNLTTIIKKSNQTKIFWNYYRTVKDNQEIKKMCDKFFDFLLNKISSESVLKVRLENNDSCAFNDKLVLHGREGFTAKKDRERIVYSSMWNYK